MFGTAAVGLGGCGGGSSSVVRPGDSGATGPASTTSTTATTVGPPSTATPTSPPAGGQRVTVTPSAGLRSPQTVVVKASGFSPSQSLVVNECAAKGTATGPGDCNLNGMQTVTSDAAGRVTVEFTVVRGPFGANGVECGQEQRCLVSVSQATFSPTEEASVPITFR